MKTHTANVACLLILAITALIPLWAQGVDEAGARARVLALEHVWNQAEALSDLKAMDAILDNGLVYVDFDGTLMTKAELLSRVKSEHIQQGITESMTAQIFGDTAIVTGTYLDRELKDGKPFLRRGRFVDAWVRKNQTWVCVSAQATPILR